jgi:excisionase family DNA binding protein
VKPEEAMNPITNAWRNRPGSEAAGGQGPALLDVKAVADLLSCSPRHIRRLSCSGRMTRPVLVGRLARWRREEIERWIEEGCPVVGKRA